MASCITFPTQTLYGTQTIVEAMQTGMVTMTVQVAPSIRTEVVPVTRCAGGPRCVVTTKTYWKPIPGSSTTTVSTIYSGNRTAYVTTPTATLYASSCFQTSMSSIASSAASSNTSNITSSSASNVTSSITSSIASSTTSSITSSIASSTTGSITSSIASSITASIASSSTSSNTTSQITPVPVPSATTIATSSKTLLGPNTDGGGSSPDPAAHRAINIGAIVGGLIGGFLAPFLLVLLFRWLRRKHVMRTLNSPPPEDVRSVDGSHHSPTFPRPLSPAILPPLHRALSLSDGDHASPSNAAAGVTEQVYIDRRPSRASRMSRTSYERRSVISPVGSLYEYPASIARRPSTGHHVSLPRSSPPLTPPSPRTPSGPIIIHDIDYDPEAQMAQDGTTGSSGSGSGSGGGYFFPYEPRRAVSPMSLSDHPYALAQPVPTGDFQAGGSYVQHLTEYASPSLHGHEPVLESVEEHDSPQSETVEIQDTSPSSTVSDIVNVHPPQFSGEQTIEISPPLE